MFYPKKMDGVLRSWEYLPAAAGTYQAGQLLNVSGGKLAALSAASTTTPPYLCQADAVVEDGQELPVTRVNGEDIYETVLGAADTSLAMGKMLQVGADGKSVNATATGTFEVVSFDGTAADSVVRGRFRVAAK